MPKNRKHIFTSKEQNEAARALSAFFAESAMKHGIDPDDDREEDEPYGNPSCDWELNEED